MKLEESSVRAIRLTKIPYYLQSHPQGLTSKELAKLCGVSPRTIQRDLAALQLDLQIPVMLTEDRYSILGDYILPPVSFSLYEAVALFLAARLAIRHVDEYNPHVANALIKISCALPQHLADKVKESVDAFKNKRKNPHLIYVFEIVALAWTTHRQVAMQYQSLQSRGTKDWVLDPYFVEMSGVGDSCYVIGHAVRAGKEGLITFKLDRIKKAELTTNSFVVPRGLDIDKQLASSWSIIWGDDTQVKLKFSPAVTRRVKESVWHPSQRIEDSGDGGCVLTVRVGSAMEMTPWIRGWGSDVEVLEPSTLREEFHRWAHQLYNMYCLSGS